MEKIWSLNGGKPRIQTWWITPQHLYFHIFFAFINHRLDLLDRILHCTVWCLVTPCCRKFCRLSISRPTLLCTFRKVLRILFQSGIWVLDLEFFGIWGTISSDMIYCDWWRPWLGRSSGEIKLAAERFWPQDCDCKLVSLSRVKSIILN